jgi:hypothetical protein
MEERRREEARLREVYDMGFIDLPEYELRLRGIRGGADLAAAPRQEAAKTKEETPPAGKKKRNHKKGTAGAPPLHAQVVGDGGDDASVIRYDPYTSQCSLSSLWL